MKVPLSFMILILAMSSAIAEEATTAAIPEQEPLCRTCHGEKGAAPIEDTYPKINGQNEAYLLNSMKDYKRGRRTGPLALVMSSAMVGVGNKEMKALAAYYSQQ